MVSFFLSSERKNQVLLKLSFLFEVQRAVRIEKKIMFFSSQSHLYLTRNLSVQICMNFLRAWSLFYDCMCPLDKCHRNGCSLHCMYFTDTGICTLPGRCLTQIRLSTFNSFTVATPGAHAATALKRWSSCKVSWLTGASLVFRCSVFSTLE